MGRIFKKTPHANPCRLLLAIVALTTYVKPSSFRLDAIAEHQAFPSFNTGLQMASTSTFLAHFTQELGPHRPLRNTYTLPTNFMRQLVAIYPLTCSAIPFHCLSDVGALCSKRPRLNSIHLPCSNGGYASNIWRLQRRRLA